MRHQSLILFDRFKRMMNATGSDFEGLHNFITDHYKLVDVETQGMFHELVSNYMTRPLLKSPPVYVKEYD